MDATTRADLLKIRDEQQKAAPALVDFMRAVKEQDALREIVRQVSPFDQQQVVFLSYR
jgi:hypothetical protein